MALNPTLLIFEPTEQWGVPDATEVLGPPPEILRHEVPLESENSHL